MFEEEGGENMNTKVLHMVTTTLVLVGALNWGLVGLLDLNLVAKILGSGTMLERIVYDLVGLSAIVELVTHQGICTMCKVGKKK